MDIFASDKLKFAGQRGFQGRDIHFTIALPRVTVADREKGAFRVNRNEKRGAGDQLLVVEIARMDAGRSTANSACRIGWRDAHAAEERAQRDFNSLTKAGDHALL